MNEQTDIHRGQLREINEEIAFLKTLEDHDLYKRFIAKFKDDLEAMRNNYELIKPDGLDGLVDKEYFRGQISGMRLVIEYHEGIKEQLHDAAEMIKQALTDLETQENEDE